MPHDLPVLLVVGATGKLGRFLRAAWGAHPPAAFRPLWQSRRPVAGADWVAWDPLSGNPMPRADAVLMLAGVTAGPPAALALNTALAEAACAAAARVGAGRVFLASSLAVYGATNAGPATEATPPAPLRPYGQAKCTMESAAAAWRAEAGPGAPAVTVLRIGNVVGADALAPALASRRRVTLDRFPGGGGPVRSYIGPGSLAGVLARLTARAVAGAVLPEVLNLAAPGGVAMADLAGAAGLPVVWQPAPAGAIENAVMDVTRLMALAPLPPGASHPAAMLAELHALTAEPAA